MLYSKTLNEWTDLYVFAFIRQMKNDIMISNIKSSNSHNLKFNQISHSSNSFPPSHLKLLFSLKTVQLNMAEGLPTAVNKREARSRMPPAATTGRPSGGHGT